MQRVMFALSILCISIAACSTLPVEIQPSSAMPTDFSLEATIAISGPNSGTQRIVVLPDGSLHGDVFRGEPSYSNQRPPLVRVLRQHELESLWEVTRYQIRTNSQSAEPCVEKDSNVVVYAFNRRWAWSSDESSPNDAPLIQRLSELAQLEDKLTADRPTMPRRYNFGPDPYSRYRNATGK